jgi:glycosyltransferase involved in cell wall biosynthesis
VVKVTIRTTLKIAFLCTSGLDYPSPRGRWLPIAQEFARAGHEPTLLMLHPTWDRLNQYESEQAGVRLRYVGQMHVYGQPGKRQSFGPAKLMAVSLRAALALAAHAIQVRADLIQIAKPQPINGLAGLIAARVRNAPILVDCDDYEAGANRFAAKWQQRMVAFWENRLPRMAQGVSVNSRYMQQHCEEHGVLADHLCYVPNGIGTTQFAPPAARYVHALRTALGVANHPTLAYIGAISSVAHGVELLLDAFALTHAQLPQARLLLVGAGDDQQVLHQHANSSGIGQAVIWVGHVAPSATRAYMALASATCDPVADTPAMAARSPLKIVESMAQGVPVLTSAIGDRRELLGEGAGLFVAPGNAAALAVGITTLLSDSSMCQRMALAARQQAEHLRWERIAVPWVRMVSALSM